MVFFFALPFLLQGLAIFFDEFYFHRRRGLPKWERRGHPLDTLTVGFCFTYLLNVPYSSYAGLGYITLAVFSCAFVTKDEWVHTECCTGFETWLHSVLFILHPVVLIFAGAAWYLSSNQNVGELLGWQSADLQFAIFTLKAQAAVILIFLIYQTIYWNFPWKQKRS